MNGSPVNESMNPLYTPPVLVEREVRQITMRLITDYAAADVNNDDELFGDAGTGTVTVGVEMDTDEVPVKVPVTPLPANGVLVVLFVGVKNG